MPYRFVMTGHAPGAGHLEVQWDTFKSGSHATDYITTWNATESGDPCMDAFGGGCGAADTIGIPSPSPDAPAGEPVGAVFTIWGGTFTGIDPYMQTGDTDAGQTSIRVDFTTAGGTVVIAWGGHISKFSEWDPETTAVDIPGSPYHMRLIDASEGSGNQDLSLSANAIIIVDATITINKVLSPGADSGLFDLEIDGSTAGTGADVGNGGTTGAITVAPDVAYTVGETAGTGTVLANYTSVLACLDGADPVTITSNIDTSGSITPTDGQNVICTITNTRLTRTLVLQKATSPTDDAGRFDLRADGALIVDEAANGSNSSTTVDVGDVVTVLEEAGDVGSLANYTSLLSCTGTNVTDPGGTTTGDLTVEAGAGDITCTFTNTRLTRTLVLQKATSPTDDAGRFDLRADGALIVDEAANGSNSSTTVDVGDVVTVLEEAGDVGSLADYTSLLSCTGTNVTDPGGTTTGDLTVADGAGDITCTFTNTLITAGITLIKNVSPNNGDDFGLDIDGPDADDASDTNVADGGSISVPSGVPGVYNLSESNGTGALADYTTTLNCTGGGSDFTYTVGDTSGSITLAADDAVSCTFTNTFITAGITLIKAITYLTTPRFQVTIGTMEQEPKTLQEAIIYFSDSANCRDYMIARRWPKGVTCPRCRSEKVKFQEKYNRWQCSSHHDRRQFTVKTGTIFEESPLALSKWLPAVWLIVNCKNGISSYEIHRALGVTQKTAWFMLHRIRLGMQARPFVRSMSGEVEVDETFIGGKARNMHKSKRAEKITGTGGKDKTAVLGILERGGSVRTTVIPNTKKKVLQPLVKDHVAVGSALYSDALKSYEGLSDEYDHQVIDHAVAYVEGNVHTNGMENFWSLLKRGLHGTYVSVEPFHLFRYLDEQAWRFNHRKEMKDADRFSKVLTQVVGKRVTYDELTGKVGETTIN